MVEHEAAYRWTQSRLWVADQAMATGPLSNSEMTMNMQLRATAHTWWKRLLAAVKRWSAAYLTWRIDRVAHKLLAQ